jgi:hypothetical protein
MENNKKIIKLIDMKLEGHVDEQDQFKTKTLV